VSDFTFFDYGITSSFSTFVSLSPTGRLSTRFLEFRLRVRRSVCVEFINQPGCARRNQVMWERESSHIAILNWLWQFPKLKPLLYLGSKPFTCCILFRIAISASVGLAEFPGTVMCFLLLLSVNRF
jgi:hypothetical protein